MRIYFFILFLLIIGTVKSQNLESEYYDIVNVEQILQFDDNIENSLYITQLFDDLIKNPLDLNTITISALLQFPFVTYRLAYNIINYRTVTGKFYSVTELKNVEGMIPEIFEQIKPFVTVKYETNLDIKISEGKNLNNSGLTLLLQTSLINNVSDQLEPAYLGSSLKVINKLKMNLSDRYFFNFITEKDRGEQSVADFYSFGLGIKNISWFRKICIGDFLITSGQGIVLGGNYFLSKSTNVINSIRKTGENLKINSGVYEGRINRGAAFELNFNSFKFLPFFSYSFIDASVDSSGQNITSISDDGYHRTYNEILKKGNQRQNLSGAILGFERKNFQAELLFFNLLYSSPYTLNNPFGINGKNFNFLSLSYDVGFSHANLFGEIATAFKSVALNTGLIFYPMEYFGWSLLVRYYPKNFVAPLGNAFSEMSGNSGNEFGIYNGFSIKSEFGLFKAFFDLFGNYYPAYLENLPKTGNDFLFEFTSFKYENLNLNLLFRMKNKWNEKKFTNEFGLSSSLSLLESSYLYRAEITKEFSKKIRMKFRFDYLELFYSQLLNKENGYMAYSDFSFAPFKSTTVKTRFIFYKTDSYNSRLYEFENNIPSYMYTQPLYGEGFRWYINISYNALNYLKLHLKYSSDYKKSTLFINNDGKLIFDKGNQNDLFFFIEFSL